MAKNITVKDEYQKELNRIKRFVKSAHKRGYRFETDPIPKEVKKPTKKSVERLQKITPSTLYSKATYFDPILQARVSGTEEQKLIRSRSSKKAAQKRATKKITSGKTAAGQPPSAIDDVLTYVEELLSGWSPQGHWSNGYTTLKENDTRILRNVLTGAIAELGREQVARNLEANATEVKQLAWHICYGSSDFKWQDIEGEITRITEIIRGRVLSVDESKELTDIAEGVTSYEAPQE